ncbi:MAG TPA: hypothetical protein VK454_08535 [Myxococcaceae bacterium]|nr:hypothetical protein [Myxococcaceae bacterium]
MDIPRRLATRPAGIAVVLAVLAAAGTVEADDAGPSPVLHLEPMAAIRSGDFPKVTNVVVSRHGTVVYEGYFGGTDARTQLDINAKGMHEQTERLLSVHVLPALSARP